MFIFYILASEDTLEDVLCFYFMLSSS